MLILARTVGERIVISAREDMLLRKGDQIAMIVVSSRDKEKVKLGFEAQDRIAIDREEIHTQKNGGK